MSFFLPIRPLLKGWVISFLVFGILAFLLVGQFALTMSMPLSEALRMGARDWLVWAILTPLIFRFVDRLPLERERWVVALPAHLFCAIAAVALANWWAENVLPPQRLPGFRRPESRSQSEQAGPQSKALPEARPLRPPGPRRNPFGALFLIGFRVPIFLAITSVAHALHFYRRSLGQGRLEASLTKARLEALKMQLQPHFLFNSLNAIAALVHNDPDAADEMLAALSDLLRLTLETSGEQELPLRRELEFVERYLAIEQVRFGERLRFELDVAPDTLDALVPTFLLQPLVENAVRHGLEPRSAVGILTISARHEGGALRLVVADNGAGLANGQPEREGVGLSNTRARLRELYRDSAQLDLRSEEGLHVEVQLPFRTLAG
jgi:Histidine kinase/Histidine kinase-, DNA gyrase B-, and HSP90-like ATPase